VDNATVQLSIPQKSIFLTDEQDPVKPTSTVTVWPAGSGKLTATQVDGIMQIVAGSVEDLTLDNIRVIDGNTGVPMEGASPDDPMTQITTQEELRLSWAKSLENNVYKLYGLGNNQSFDNFSVVASPYLDFSAQEYTNETIKTPEGFDEGSGALLEQHIKKESAENYATGGVPGTDTNPGETTPEYPMAGTEGTGTYSLSDNQLAYGYDKRVEKGTNTPGEFVPEKSTLSIVLGYGINIPDATNLTDDFLNTVRDAASKATRIPADNIQVSTMQLAPPQETKVPITDRLSSLVEDYGVLALLLFLILTLVLSLLLHRKKEDAGVEDLQLQLAEGIVEPEVVAPVKDIDIDEKSEIRRQLENLIRQKPEAVASLLRNWLTEEWD
jgi:flagellar M-ring protein FliF